MARRARDDMPVIRLGVRVRTLLLGVAIGLSAACGTVDSMRQGVGRVNAVSASVEKSLGVKARVGFEYQGGVLAEVSVMYDTLPVGRSPEEIIRISAEAVKAEFKESPKSLVVGFLVRP